MTTRINNILQLFDETLFQSRSHATQLMSTIQQLEACKRDLEQSLRDIIQNHHDVKSSSTKRNRTDEFDDVKPEATNTKHANILHGAVVKDLGHHYVLDQTYNGMYTTVNEVNISHFFYSCLYKFTYFCYSCSSKSSIKQFKTTNFRAGAPPKYAIFTLLCITDAMSQD